MKYKPGHVALERALSKLGVASRTVARARILNGEVRVNGVLRRDPLFSVMPERARIELDEKPVEAVRPRIFLLNKPRGTVTTHSDEKGRPTVFSLLTEEKLHLIAVGRLDLATTGLLILTNDTRLSDWLTDPANRIPRTYLASVRGEITDSELARIRSGVEDRGEKLSAEAVSLRKSSRRESHLVITLCEGKNREIRRLFKALGHEVTRLKRVSFGGLELGKLEPGCYHELSIQELRSAFPGAPIRNEAVTVRSE